MMTDPSPIDYSPVTSDTFSTFIWTNQTTVVIHKCLCDILPSHLNSCRETLVHIKFTNLTKVSNIKSILRHCPNLSHLTFNDALIDDYKHEYKLSNNTSVSVQSSSMSSSKMIPILQIESESKTSINHDSDNYSYIDGENDKGGNTINSNSSSSASDKTNLSNGNKNNDNINIKISNSAVLNLTIICPVKLTKNEYWLLHFFTHAVDLPNLVSLSFYSFTTIGSGGGGLRGHQQGQGQGQGGGGLLPLLILANNNINGLSMSMRKETTEVMNRYGPPIDTRIVSMFLLKYKRTLHKLWIGRPGFDLEFAYQNPNPYSDFDANQNIDPNLNQNHESDTNLSLSLLKQLKEIRLNFLSVSIGSSGVTFLLQNQSHLETLNLVSNINLQTIEIPNISILMSHIFLCLSRNSTSLKEVKLVPTIITGSHLSTRRSILIEQNILDHFTVDCSLFSNCTSLKYLCLSLRAYRHEFEMWSDYPPIIQGTKLRNMHLIPATNLVELCLPVEEYSRDELEKLAERFSEFRKLRKFYFGTSQLNPLNSFLIRLVWVQVLTGLPKIEKVVFHNGVLQDVEETRRIIQSVRVDNGNDRHNNLQENARNEVEVDERPVSMRNVRMIYDPPRYTFEISRRSTPRPMASAPGTP